MSHETPDQELYRLIRTALIALGHRPTKPADIEAMLRACTGEQIAEDKLQRMLKKVRGEIPLGPRTTPFPSSFEDQLTETQRELVALHRAEGKELPPEIKELLERLRKEAQQGREHPPTEDTQREHE